MQRVSVLLFLLVFCFATALQAQAPAPKPDPELGRLHFWVGHWTYEGQSQSGAWGAGGKFTGEFTGQMILGGFFLQARWKEQGALGEMRSLEVVGYDSVNKNIFSSGFQDEGSTWSGKVSLSGSTLTFTGKVLSAGKQYPIRATYILAPDLASATRKEEISVDGKSWTTTSQSKWTKVKPAAKK
jgi:hypothetical protein